MITETCDCQARPEPGRWLTGQEFAALAKVHIATVRRWKRQGIGPTAHRVGPRLVRYSHAEVTAWLNSTEAAAQ